RTRRPRRHGEVAHVLCVARVEACAGRARGDVTMTDDPHLAVGAYLLGALDPRERAEAERHFSSCRRCRDEIAALSAAPGLMSRIGLDEALSGPPPVDDAMLERLLAAASRERAVVGRRRWLVAVAAAAAVVGATVGGVGLERSL